MFQGPSPHHHQNNSMVKCSSCTVNVIEIFVKWTCGRVRNCYNERWIDLLCVFTVEYILPVLTRSLIYNLKVILQNNRSLDLVRSLLPHLYVLEVKDQNWCQDAQAGVFYTISTTSQVVEIRDSRVTYDNHYCWGERKFLFQTDKRIPDNARSLEDHVLVLINF